MHEPKRACVKGSDILIAFIRLDWAVNIAACSGMKFFLAVPLIVMTSASSYGLSESMAPASRGSLFSNIKIHDVELTAQFQELFAKKWAPEAKTFYVDGNLSFKDAENKKFNLRVKVRTKGKSTRDCTFPKLELMISEQAASKTMFEGIKTIDLNTHCAQPSDPNVSLQLKASFNNRREVLIYRMMEILNMQAMKAKAIKIKYYDTTENLLNPNAPANIYDAFFLQDMADFKRKNNFVEIEGAPQADVIVVNPTEAEAKSNSLTLFKDVVQMGSNMDREDILRLATFEFLIGNDDWFIKLDENDGYTRLWNIKLVRKAQETKVRPVAYDFNFSRLFQGVKPAYEIKPNFLAFADQETKLKVFKHFLSKKTEILEAIKEIDDPGQDQLRDFLSSGFSRIESYLNELQLEPR